MRIKVSKARRQTLLLLILLFLFVGFPAGAQDVNTPTIAPINPAFTQHLQRTAVLGIEGTTQSLTTGIIPPPLDLSHMKGKQVSTTRLLAGFPHHSTFETLVSLHQ